ncbi:MAG: DUF72 domain-containing protein [Candidatus Promineifilaceae bacterium]
MTTWKIGTVGFGYKQWLGTFYPERMQSSRFLPYYAEWFDSAEIDSTFYGTPKLTSVQKWRRDVPPNFTFCPKTPRSITHDTPLEHAVAPMTEFVERVQLLGNKLGAILIQYPATLTVSSLMPLDRFLAQLPRDVRYAIEFRHPSWERNEVDAMLRAHNVARVVADYGQANEHRMTPFVVRNSADFLYLRFIGWHGAFNTKNMVKLNQRPRLERWQTVLQPHLKQVKTVYAYMNNDYSGYSIATANLLKQLLGLPNGHPKIFKQQSLF